MFLFVVLLMNRFIKICVIMFVLVLIQSCARSKVVDVKSPCVSGEDGPCSVRKPVNTWMNA